MLAKTLGIAAALMLGVGTATARQPFCPPAKASAAGMAADRLTSWGAVADYYKRYRACDDGGTAEVSSDKIAKILAQHWNTFSELVIETKKIPSLRTFVVTHINSTLDTDELEMIERASRLSCPALDLDFCQQINRAAADALK